MITEKLKESFRSNAYKNAFCFGTDFYSYHDLEKRTLSAAGHIFSNVKKNNPRIAVVTNYDIDTYASVFAIWLCGGTFIPLNPAVPLERNKKIIDISKAEIILNSNCYGIFEEEINTSETSGILSCFPARSHEEHDLMYILFTSGSTGEPKGVPISYANVSAFIGSFMSDGYYFSNSDRFLQPFELSFDASLDCYLIPALYGACIFPVPSEGMKYLQALKIMQEHKITVTKMTPSMVALLAPYFGKIILPSLRYCLFGGEGLPESLVKEWSKSIPNSRIHNMYGPTEATVECFFYDATPGPDLLSYKGFASIGKPAGDTLAIICGSNLNELPVYEEGELCIAGSQVTEGYLNNKELNKKSFFEIKDGRKKLRFYRTGDIAMKDGNGYYFCIGRNDRQVKIQGYRIELDEIEAAASKLAADCRFAVICKNEQVIMYTDKQAGNELSEKLREKLPAWMVPAEIITLQEIPLNVNGKTDYRKLMENES